MDADSMAANRLRRRINGRTTFATPYHAARLRNPYHGRGSAAQRVGCDCESCRWR